MNDKYIVLVDSYISTSMLLREDGLGSWGVFPLTLVAFIITAIKANTIERRKKHYKKYNNDDFKDTNLLLFFLITAFSLALIFATIMTIWLNNGN